MYKDLSLKEKAKVLLYGGKLGLTSVEDIAKLYDEAISYLKEKPIISPYGQWKYPGRDTIIPSNNITMDNVNYPVLGISDTGDAKVMIPWNDYKFRGSMVYEHPLIGNLALEGKKLNRQKISDNEYFSIMEKVALENNDKWNKDRKLRKQRLLSVDEELVRLLNSNDYDYRGYYTKYPNSKANADTHWTDEFKTIYHPTFSKESRYSGIIDRNYNPYGYIGGSWGNNDEFIPAPWLLDNQYQLGGLAKPFSYGDIPDVRYLKGGETQKYLNVPDYNVALYNTVSPLGDFPNFWEALAYRRLVKDKLKNGNIYERDYPVGNTQGEKTAMAAWAKRLGIPYDELDLPVYNGDTVTLPYSLVLEIPYDTNILKNRIQLNKALLDKYSKYRYSDVVDAAIKADLYNLDKLRETYKTGKPVGLTEFGWNSRQLVNNGEILPIEDIYSPLNVLGNYNVRYDKPTNRLYYSDEYDFNQFENYVPGEPFRIRGYIDLNNKALGGNLFKKGGIYIKPENRGKFTALKKRTGHSASWFKAHGTPALKKMATFALNARKWHHKHDDGGYLYSEGGFLLAPYLYVE